VALDSGAVHFVWEVVSFGVGVAACKPDWADAATAGEAEGDELQAEAISIAALAGVEVGGAASVVGARVLLG
jgi:hypothetical protein